MEPKPRPLTLPVHVLAYLGEYMKMFESGVKKITYEAAAKAKSNTQKHQAQSPAGR